MHPSGAHVDLWEEAFSKGERRQVKTTWINSHLSKEAFEAKFGRQQLWRREANAKADGLAGAAAAQAFNLELMQRFKASDAHVEAVLRQLAVRGAAISQAKTYENRLEDS